MNRVMASDRRTLWGNLALGMLLLLLAIWLLALHVEGMPWPHVSTSRGLSAAASVSVWLGLVGWTWWRRRPAVADRQPRTTATAGILLIATASQTGYADQLAQQTAQSLIQAGMSVQCIELGLLDEAQLRGAERVLFIVSTTGEGDAPDSAAAFAARVMRMPRELHGVRYGLLALGDRDYDDFCGFGRALHHWLLQSGAQPLFDPVEVDNGDDGALRHWQHHLSLLSGAVDLPDWQRPTYQRWTLIERRLLNPQSLGGPCFSLALEPVDGVVAWQAGDIAEIEPRHDPLVIQAWLDVAGMDGSFLQGGETLAERLARSLLPDPGSVLAALPATLIEQLRDLPHREYSIASLPVDGSLQLLVRQMHRDDGQLGLGSGWLTAHLPLGGELALRVRSNPNFRVPAPHVPMILIGNGTGLAGLRALLKQREATASHRNWLVFGERQPAHDFFHGGEIERWQHSGHLARVDLAWSRDPSTPRYVQDVLLTAGDAVRTWVAEGAAIYVCGSLAGMAPGVDAALRQLLGEAAVEDLRMQGRYCRDVY